MDQAGKLVVSASSRTVLGKQVKQLRAEGLVPGVLYGHSFDAQSLQFDTKVLDRFISRVSGSQLIAVQIEGQDEPEWALLRAVQRDVITRQLLHVDFYRVQMGERLRAEIPLVIVGESPALAETDGIMIQGISSIEVECLPSALVEAIEVDISDLVELDQSLCVRDLVVPADIDVLSDPDEMIARVVRIVEEAVLEEEVAEEVAEIGEVEVIGRALEEEEDES
ncbi:MAG: 50S ribosomal protein L25 [Anaerolineae bacterium]|nr:50S ribosomal protein L25 [Anaerolineae bacterium]